jgi:O-antigen/teichoic acid export membrane protein
MTIGQPGAMTSRVVRNTFSNYIGKFANLGVWFFLTPFILSRLGAGTYGLWVLVGSVAAYGSLFDLGIGGAITKYVAEYRATGVYEEARGLIATALSIHTVLGLIVFLLSLAFAPAFPTLFHLPTEQHGTAITLVILSGLGAGLLIPSTAPPAILAGLHRYDLINLTSVCGLLLSAAASVVVLLLWNSIASLIIINIVVNLLMQALNVWLIHHTAPELRIGWRGTSRPLVRRVASFSFTLFILQLNGYLEAKTDEIVIGANLPIASVTPYNIALRLSSLPQMLAAQFASQILPLASTLDAQHARSQLRSLYIVGTRLTLALFLPVGIVITALAAPILGFWVGPAYSNYAHLVLILTLAGFIDMSQWPAGLILQGMARHHVLAAMSLLSGVGNLVLSLVLVRVMGLTGVALGTLIPTSIVCLGIILPYSMRVIGVGLREFIADILAPVLLPALPMVAVVFILKTLLGVNSLIGLLAVMAASMLVYAVAYLIMAAGTPERQVFHNTTSSVIRQAKVYLKGS